jgi:hypothetical protein
MSHLHPISARGRRLAAAALTSLAAGSLVLGFAAPATAEGSASFDGAPVDGAQITSSAPINITLSATAPRGERLTHFTATLESVGSTVSPPYSVTVDRVVEKTATYAVTMAWSPNAARAANAAAPSTDANGTYRLRTTTETCSYLLVDCDPLLNTQRKTAVQSRTFSVNIPPRVPSGVKVQLETSPVVAWNRNSEGDLTEYRILRSDSGPGGEFRRVGTASKTATSWTDNCADNPCAPGGTVAYKVAAVRTSPLDNAGCSKCIVSAASSASEGVAIPAAAPGTDPAAAPANPLNIPPAQPAPLPTVTAPTKQIVAPPPHSDKYAPTLPYAAPLPQQGAAPVEAPSPQVEAARAQNTAAQPVTQQRQPKAQFIAGALVLLVAAMHLARGGGMLLRSPGKTPRSAAPTATPGTEPRSNP